MMEKKKSTNEIPDNQESIESDLQTTFELWSNKIESTI